MSIRAEEIKKFSDQQAMPTRGLAQRKCACGRAAGFNATCAGCAGERLASLPPFSNTASLGPKSDSERARTSGDYSAAGAHSGHDFGTINVRPGGSAGATSGAGVDAMELPLDEQPSELDLLEDTAPADVDALEVNKSCCRWTSFEKSNDSYVDTPTDSRKNIKFTFQVNRVELASDEKKCVMVNWVKGTAKNKDGSFRKAKVFDKVVDINFPTMQIDSIDKDPVYWSTAAARWNYRPEGNGFFATDSPGPPTWSDGIDYDLKYKMCLHCIDDVTTTGDETGSGVSNPLKCIDWVFKAKFDASSGTFTH